MGPTLQRNRLTGCDPVHLPSRSATGSERSKRQTLHSCAASFLAALAVVRPDESSGFECAGMDVSCLRCQTVIQAEASVISSLKDLHELLANKARDGDGGLWLSRLLHCRQLQQAGCDSLFVPRSSEYNLT